MENIEYRSGAINASDCLSQGWELIKSNYWIFLGMVVVEIVIGFLISLIPVVGGILNLLVAAPLTCGIYFALLIQLRREKVEFSMMFEGFSRFLPAVLVTLVSTIPLLILGFAAYFASSGFSSLTNEQASIGAFRGLTLSLVLMTLFVYLLTIVLQFLLFFALPLIADYNLTFTEAVKLSVSGATNNVGGIIVLFLLEFLVMLGGILAFCIGILFVMPIIYATNIIAYRSVFPDYQPTVLNEPPRPDAYGGTYGTPL